MKACQRQLLDETVDGLAHLTYYVHVLRHGSRTILFPKRIMNGNPLQCVGLGQRKLV